MNKEIKNEGMQSSSAFAKLPIIGSYTIRDDIFCPKCGERHIDKSEWSKRLHKSHLCEKCGNVWQPHEGYTFGV
jgi:predicted RNA-binding Zn-ribbon protein involved in translation (DUF1610 family)